MRRAGLPRARARSGRYLPRAEFRYLGGWNFHTLRPLLGGGWIAEDDARHRYESRDGSDFTVVSGAFGIGNGLVVPRFVLQVSPTLFTFRISFMNRAGSRIRVVGYTPVDGRLFKHGITEYRYADTEQRFRLRMADRVVTATFEPDGTGTIRIDDKSNPTVKIREFTDIPVGGNWMRVPRFGQWADLADPDYRAAR